MEVELDRALLDSGLTESLVILALCAFGVQERHRIRPDVRSVWDLWAARLPPDLADEVRLAWDEGERLATVGRPSEQVAVRPVGAPDFARAPIVIDPPMALALLGRPLRIMLENGRNDRAFVLAFADKASLRALAIAEAAGFLVFETCGGINELEIHVGDARHRASIDVLRTMYLCDSDAIEPGAPSDPAVNVAKHLARLERRFSRPTRHFGQVLKRRAAENYAPPSAVLTWAVAELGSDEASRLIEQSRTSSGKQALSISAGKPGSTRRRLLAAIALKQLQKHPEKVCEVLDMKAGRGHDGSRTIDKVWDVLDAFQQAVLMDGFGSTFSARFYLNQEHLSDETGEISGFLGKILERL